MSEQAPINGPVCRSESERRPEPGPEAEPEPEVL
jgi:hypothetical protein